MLHVIRIDEFSSTPKYRQLGKDIGLISYNETPIKRLLFEGISTISTDFVKMGQLAAELVKTNARTKIENPFSFILRASL
jgi:DNA-binding LacI/PurR family transcriptional regulator